MPVLNTEAGNEASMTKLPSITQDMLPEGWTIKTIAYPGTVVLKAPGDRGCLTVHLRARAWAPGIPMDRLRLKREPSLEPKGRGWLRCLVAEATSEFLCIAPSQPCGPEGRRVALHD